MRDVNSLEQGRQVKEERTERGDGRRGGEVMLLYKTDPWSGITAWSGEEIY